MMTDLQRIEFAEAALACKGMGLMSHPEPMPKRQARDGQCVFGRIRHIYHGGESCIYCGAPRGGKPPQSEILKSQIPASPPRLNGLDLS